MAETRVPASSPGDVTLILGRLQRGDVVTADEILPLVYDDLRRLAAARLASERSGYTLQPTALVHEAWLRLGGDRQPAWQNRAQFFSAAAEAMRRILIDRARRRLAQRRAGRQHHVDIEQIEIAVATDAVEVLQVNDALERFVLVEPEKAELVKLRYFAGLTLSEAASALDISEATAVRWWSYARAWLLKQMRA